MLLHGIEVDIKNHPSADPGFLPLGLYMDAFLKTASKPVSIAVERENGNICVFDTFLHGDAAHSAADLIYLERIVKFLLWSRGGWRIFICGDEAGASYIKTLYTETGARAFDKRTMETIYEKQFEVVSLPLAEAPRAAEETTPVGGFLDGCRIGLDVGGSSRKVCALIDGKTVYNVTEPWRPLEHADPEYHIAALTESLCRAAAALPRVDAVGISTAGIYVNHRTRIASIFRSVPKEAFDAKITGIYPAVCKALGAEIPFAVANDGDAAALAGSISRRARNVVGISMGTSEAGGYVDENGRITGRLNEFAFLPLDLRQTARDPWSGDFGCGVTYLSSEAVVRLAKEGGIAFRSGAQAMQDQVREVQRLVQSGDPAAIAVFDTIGCYLAHAIYTYQKFYRMEHVIVMGGISAGPGGAVLLRRCRRVLAKEYPDLKAELILPEEDERAGGQSFAAATLVKL
ncbi:MAG: ROK family protein [Clostridia bacterium]